MTNRNFWGHVLDVLKGAAGAALMAFAVTFLNTLGAQIPAFLGLGAAVAGAVTGVKFIP